MASPRSYQVCPPAEKLQTSQVGPSNRAIRAKKHSLWNLAVRSLLDIDGRIEIARCCNETGEAEDRRVDHVVAELEQYNISSSRPARDQVVWGRGLQCRRECSVSLRETSPRR